MSRTSRTTLRRSRTSLLAAAALVAAAAGTAAASGPHGASAAAAGCTVAYTIQNQWNGGFTSAVSVTNNGAALSGWQLEWTFAGGEQVTQGWNAAVS
ncbi:cellulose binding domain-containing protein, partial [Streptomyces sp. NPDC055080]